MYTIKKVVFIVSVVFLVNTAFGQPSTTVTLQQGVDGYDGCSWINLMNFFKEDWGNHKYSYKFVHSHMISAYYECWGVTDRNEARSAIKFDLSSIVPSNATVTAATLDLNREGNPFNGATWHNTMTFELYKVTKSWTQPQPNDYEDPLTYFDNWDLLAESFDPQVVDSLPAPVNSTGWFSFDVKDAVTDFLQDPSTNYGIMVFMRGFVLSTRGGALANIYSPVTSNEDDRPKLTITYTEGVSPILNSSNAHLKPVVISSLRDNVFQISSTKRFVADITINSVNGSVVHRLGNQDIAVGNTSVPLNKKLKNGLYLVKVRGKGVSVNQKTFVIQ